MGIRAHNSVLSSRASRQKAAVDAIVLSINDVELTNHMTIADLLTSTKTVASTVGCIGQQEFRTRVRRGDIFGDGCPLILVSGGRGKSPRD